MPSLRRELCLGVVRLCDTGRQGFGFGRDVDRRSLVSESIGDIRLSASCVGEMQAYVAGTSSYRRDGGRLLGRMEDKSSSASVVLPGALLFLLSILHARVLCPEIQLGGVCEIQKLGVYGCSRRFCMSVERTLGDTRLSLSVGKDCAPDLCHPGNHLFVCHP